MLIQLLLRNSHPSNDDSSSNQLQFALATGIAGGTAAAIILLTVTVILSTGMYC